MKNSDDHINIEKKIIEDQNKKKTISNQQMLKYHQDYDPLIRKISNHIYFKHKTPPTIDENDLISAGFDGLLKAAERFDEKKVDEFKHYASIRIRGEMLDLIRKEWSSKGSFKNELKESIKQRISQVIDNTLEDKNTPTSGVNLLSLATTSGILSMESLADAGYEKDIINTQQSIEETIEQKELSFKMDKKINELPSLEKRFIHLFYKSGYSQKDISRMLSISEAKTSRVHRKSLEILRKLIEKD